MTDRTHHLRLIVVSLALALSVLLAACVRSGGGTAPAVPVEPSPVAQSSGSEQGTGSTADTAATATSTVAATVAATVTPSPTVTPTTRPSATATPAATDTPPPPVEVSGVAAMGHVERLAGDTGSRVAGTAGEAAAADHIAASLEDLGFQVERQPFPFQSYEDRGAELAVAEPRAAAIPSLALRLAAAGEVSGTLVPAGLGRPEDVAQADLVGKVALLRRGEITLGDKVRNAAAGGAIGVVITNNEPGNFAGTLGTAGSIPAVSVSQEDGDRLRALVNEGPVAVRLLVRSATREGTSENVIGTLAGSGPGTVVIGAHYDSVAAGPGANDNASGTATMLELARVLASRDLPYTLKVIAFGAEEIGLIGSRYYVASMPASEREDILAMINLDMVGVGNTLRYAGSEDLSQAAEEAALELDLATSLLDDARADASDHASFRAAGVPVVFLTWTPDPNYHRATDTPEQIDPALLAATAKVVLAVLEQL